MGVGAPPCNGGPDGVRPLLGGGRRIVVDGHAIAGVRRSQWSSSGRIDGATRPAAARGDLRASRSPG